MHGYITSTIIIIQSHTQTNFPPILDNTNVDQLCLIHLKIKINLIIEILFCFTKHHNKLPYLET
jgi:hypothetical protein